MIELLGILGLIVLIFLAIAVASVEVQLREMCKHLKTISRELRYRGEYTEEELNNAKNNCS